MSPSACPPTSICFILSRFLDLPFSQREELHILIGSRAEQGPSFLLRRRRSEGGGEACRHVATDGLSSSGGCGTGELWDAVNLRGRGGREGGGVGKSVLWKTSSSSSSSGRQEKHRGEHLLTAQTSRRR
ncbi:hypothetical protein AMECASPLE_021988 [Ameca splendens]|uniref:Uncharacterized protein n=1 Tax=Ameca splendens TaxID=208324 RepID=A0ABV0XGV5_9TELE